MKIFIVVVLHVLALAIFTVDVEGLHRRSLSPPQKRRRCGLWLMEHDRWRLGLRLERWRRLRVEACEVVAAGEEEKVAVEG